MHDEKKQKTSHLNFKVALHRSKHPDDGRAGGPCRPCGHCLVSVSHLSLIHLDPSVDPSSEAFNEALCHGPVVDE